MGIVNPPEVNPGILRAVYRLFAESGPDFAATPTEAISLLAPPTAISEGADPQRRARLSLREAAAIGMLEEAPPAKGGRDGSKRYSLALPAPPDGLDGATADAFFARELRRLVMASDNNEPLFGEQYATEEGAEREHDEKLATTEAREFTRIQAWLLTRSPTGLPIAYADKDPQRNVQRLQDLFGGRDLVVNGNRWTSFRRWSLFLGFSRQGRVTNRLGLVPDPTQAIRQELAAIGEDETELPLVELRDRLAAALPVLDCGTYRRAVLEHTGEAEDAHDASPTLAISLLRCSSAGLLELSTRADFDGGALRVGGKAYTHALLGAA